MHDPKAQDVLTEYFRASDDDWFVDFTAEGVLTTLADNGLCVVSDAAEPADAEQRADSLAAAQHRVTFADPPSVYTYVTSRHADGKSCGLRGCPCMERDA